MLGTGFQLIASPEGIAALTDGDRQLLGELAVNVLDLAVAQDLDGLYGQLLADHGAAIALIRPDHIVYGAASPSESPELIRSLRDALRMREAVT